MLNFDDDLLDSVPYQGAKMLSNSSYRNSAGPRGVQCMRV